METIQGITLRGICSNYFEKNVAPILKHLQEAQEQLNSQNNVLSDKFMQQSHDLKGLVQKLRAQGTLDSTGIDEKFSPLRLAVEADALQLREELQNRIAGLESKLDKLAKEQHMASAAAEVKKMQVIMTAASSNFNKQLKDVKQQVQRLQKVQEQGVSLASLSESPDSPKSPLKDLSDREETTSLPDSDAGSMPASVAGSTVSGLSPEDRAELKKMQAVVAAAGTVFNKELREIRKEVRALQSDVRQVKMGAGALAEVQ